MSQILSQRLRRVAARLRRSQVEEAGITADRLESIAMTMAIRPRPGSLIRALRAATAQTGTPIDSTMGAAVKALQGTQYALIGGFSVQTYVSTRVSEDIDFVIRAEDVPTAIENLTAARFDNHGMTEVGNLRFHIFERSGVGCDLMLAEKDYQLEAIQTARTVPLEGISIRNVQAPYLVLFKLDAMRGEKDEQDIKDLIRSGAIDVESATRMVEQFLPDLAEDFSSLAQMAELGL